MKRLLILFVVIVTALSLLAFPIAADKASDTDEPKETTSVSNENDNNGNKDEDKNATLTDVFNSISDIAKYFKEPERILEFIVIDIGKFQDGSAFITLINGGYNYCNGKDNSINFMISTLYNITYPIGIIAMVLAWIFGIAKSSTNTALDIKDKNSLIRSMLGLVIGLAAITAAPYVLTALTSISNWLCVKISSMSIDAWIKKVYNDELFINVFEDNAVNLYEVLSSFISENSNNSLDINVSQEINIILQAIYGIIVVLVIEFVFCLNILWLALLQVISPIFIGLCVSGGGRKLTFNFTKEYFKALLMPIVSLIYITLCIALLGTDNIGIIATFGIGTGTAIGGGIGTVVGGTAGTIGGGIGTVVGGTIGAIGGLLIVAIFPLVLAISTLGIAGKKLDKLIN